MGICKSKESKKPPESYHFSIHETDYGTETTVSAKPKKAKKHRLFSRKAKAERRNSVLQGPHSPDSFRSVSIETTVMQTERRTERTPMSVKVKEGGDEMNQSQMMRAIGQYMKNQQGADEKQNFDTTQQWPAPAPVSKFDTTQMGTVGTKRGDTFDTADYKAKTRPSRGSIASLEVKRSSTDITQRSKTAKITKSQSKSCGFKKNLEKTQYGNVKSRTMLVNTHMDGTQYEAVAKPGKRTKSVQYGLPRWNEKRQSSSTPTNSDDTIGTNR